LCIWEQPECQLPWKGCQSHGGTSKGPWGKNLSNG
jgi:hypothetical protein